MKKVTLLYIILAMTMLAARAQSVVGMYAQLQPSSNKRFVFQMVPAKTYEKVVVYVNFYGTDNKRIAQRAYSVTDEKDKYVRKGVCATRVFKFSLPGDVARVKIDHVNEGELLSGDEGNNAGKKIDLPIASVPLAELDK